MYKLITFLIVVMVDLAFYCISLFYDDEVYKMSLFIIVLFIDACIILWRYIEGLKL